eukprot:TRINITY_DN48705_c0_g1_i1.p1 TRINITY_DN48705_c0_g1~~TRINITY_DN48705_c0_g1_i1.p1  ORF type:complete len:240 (-),score=57.06 TRINITY_DN48705_c0_g1_i1:472-1092(-)
MAMQKIVTNIVMTGAVVLYIFGGKQPLVSQVTAVAAATTQIIMLLSELVVSRTVQRKTCKCVEETKDASVFVDDSAFRQAMKFMLEHVRASDLYVIGGFLALFALARLMHLTFSSLHSVLVALPLGMLAAAISQRMSAASDIDGDNDVLEEDENDEAAVSDEHLKASFEDDQFFLLDELIAGLDSTTLTPTSEELLASTYLKLTEA